MKYMKKFREEDGAFVILFAFLLIALIGFVGMATDLTIMHMRQNELANLCQLVREDRFTYQDSIRYSENPVEECYNIIYQTLKVDNNFAGDIKIYYQEINPANPYEWDPSRREYKLLVTVSEEFTFYFLKLFGLNTATLSQSIEGGQVIGEGGYDMIWHPSGSINDYSGSCSSPTGAFVPGDLPEDW